MHCQLLVPDLFWPDPDCREIYDGLDTPALGELLARGRRRHAQVASSEAWLGEQFGVERQQDWPIAPYCLRADGGEPGEHYWLRADPVHLKLEGNRMVLADSGQFSVAQHEADSLSDSLSAHFCADGLKFHAPRPERWYLRLERAPALETTALPEAAGRRIDALLPRGADAASWRARLNELQMLLHGHAVNQARESRGELPLNSVWLWGGGKLAKVEAARFDAIWSGDPFAAGLAQAARIAAHALPQSAADLLRASAGVGVKLIVLDRLRHAVQYGDAHAWREGIVQFERDWFAPLLEALRQERIGMLSLHALGPGETLSAEATRGDLRRFWRRIKPLGAYVNGSS